jgi:hypothetical protein
MTEGGLNEGLLRALLWVRLPTADADERSFAVIRRMRAALGRDRLPLDQFKRTIRRQFFMLLIDEARAIETLPSLLPADPAVRAEALAALRAVVEATGAMPEEVARRLAEVERIFAGEAGGAAAGGGRVRRLRPGGAGAA